jgi:hypothetical protein
MHYPQKKNVFFAPMLAAPTYRGENGSIGYRTDISTMKLLLLTSMLAAFTSVAVAQTLSLIKNPDDGEGYKDRFYSTTEYPLVVYKNALYGVYTDANIRGRLARYDGIKMELIPEPDGDASRKGGIFSEMIVFNNTLYCIYCRFYVNSQANFNNYIAAFDGKTLKILDNPDKGRGFFQTPSFTIFNNALYARYVDVNNKHRLVKIDAAVPNKPFAITGVADVKCEVVVNNTKQRKLTFTPQYTGLTGQPVTFSVDNELPSTTQPGPYSLSLSTDNPVITLKAIQEGTGGEASYQLKWLPYCGAGARVGEKDASSEIRIQVMPNPSSDQAVKILIEGATGEQVTIQVTDQQGQLVSYLRVDQVAPTLYSSAQVGSQPGIYLLNVSTSTQAKTIKVVKQ